MTPLRIAHLDYTHDCLKLFEAISDLPNPSLLDSGQPEIDSGRYDILTADPYRTLITHGPETQIITQDQTLTSAEKPISILKKHIEEDREAWGPIQTNIPFFGGAIGYLGYDLARTYMDLPNEACNDLSLPDMRMHFYSWAVVIDHLNEESYLVGAPVGSSVLDEEAWESLKARFTLLPKAINRPLTISRFRCNMTHAEYCQKFHAVQTELNAGNSYQVNLARRFTANAHGSSWAAYKQLRLTSPAPYSAYLSDPTGDILSTSPELFLQSASGKVWSKPIKGTAPRIRANPKADISASLALSTSPKERAENTMIVDLVRNDLSQSCQTGTIKVDALCALERYPAVHHLVSKVSGWLKPTQTPLDCLQNLFPAGSVTGAPKLRTMQIIDKLEPHRRSVYCGSIGYINLNGEVMMNIAIRTLIWSHKAIHCYAGGGITVASDPQAEYQETMDKVYLLLHSLNTTNIG